MYAKSTPDGLPAARLHVSTAFYICRNRLFGRRREKRWGVVFTCLTIRAIHFEVAHSLDTRSCILCVRNFIAQRGVPREIYTDNGTNFKGAAKILNDSLKQIEFSNLISTFDKTKWLFNPQAPPYGWNMGEAN
ncbi:hypothetical protein EVAR_73911_1 [Eumeta japonica]|uniref:Integrase catalytic domain-containing protein n=1 Tax=Eumeta variegata TaxID=151549 RepID=A0A4C1T9Y5_EUMVA|nr:hypothetical protein EVAR_73911_1 [Eumeta japonica]